MTRKRTDIARAASLLFYREGFGTVGIDRLVDEAGVALGTLYRHFGGRSDVVVAAMEHRGAEYLDALDRWRDLHPDRDPVLGLFDALADWAARNGGNGCLFLRAASDHPNDGAVVDAARRHKKAYLGLVARRLVDRGHDEAAAERLAPSVFLLLEGAVAAAFTLGDADAVSRAREAAGMLLGPPRGDAR